MSRTKGGTVISMKCGTEKVEEPNRACYYAQGFRHALTFVQGLDAFQPSKVLEWILSPSVDFQH